MKKIIKLLSITLAVILAITTSCKKSSDSASNSGGGNTSSDVRVTTYNPQGITATTAVCGGDAIVTQGLSLSEIGVCWSAENNPTVEDAHLSTTEWDTPFVCIITGLEPNTKYYVKAYALRGLEYYYGSEKSFTTSALNTTPEGAAAGLFSVSATQQVYFSQGNLQYQASTNTWRFAEHQWDYVGHDNENISTTYNGWIDLFGWGTGNNPTNSSTNNGDYGTFSDWGNNAISNGGNTTNTWRTLTSDEWVYVFDTRSTSSGIMYAKATVNGINGVILLPDDWSSSYYSLSNTNQSGASFTSNTITSSQWSTLEQHGAVFLPAAGYRYGTTVGYAGSYGFYWSSSAGNAYHAYYVCFYSGNFDPQGSGNRYLGLSVRLVVGL